MIYNITQHQLPKRVSKDIQTAINQVKATKSKDAAVKKAYSLIHKQFRGGKVETYSKLFYLFKTDINRIWKEGDFVHCTTMNYFLRILLVKSGKFKDAEITNHWTLSMWFSPHQFIRISNYDVDMWGSYYNVPFGKHAVGFSHN